MFVGSAKSEKEIFVPKATYCQYVRGLDVFLYRSNVFDAVYVKIQTCFYHSL